jgi:DNA-binding NarL/FixJ family response regulator
MLRGALRKVMEDSPDIRVVGETSRAAQGLALIRSASGASRLVLVTSLASTAPADEVRLIRSVRREFPLVHVLVTSASSDNATISKALLVGADSFVSQSRDVSVLLDAIRLTAQGDAVITGFNRQGSAKAPEEAFELTPRELQVLQLAAQGMTARQMARQLGVHERTVTTHLHHIYGKLGASNRVVALAEASRAGLLDPAPKPPKAASS